MNVYCYYEPIEGPAGLWDSSDQRRLIDVWRRSWSRQGWNPVVMDESWARRHPRFKEFKEKFWSLPTEYSNAYDGPCFMRYAAMSAAKGGLLVDYDVMAYDFPTVAPDPQVMRFYGGNVTTNTGCCLAPMELYEGLCQLFMEWTPDQRDWNPNAKPPQYHCSDLSFICQCMGGVREKPAWLQYRKNTCIIWGQPGWEAAPMVHFGYELRAAGRWPKADWVEKLRPF